MKTGLWIALVVTWALVVGAILGPKASISEVTALWLAGLLFATAVSMAWVFVAETMAGDDGAPWQSNAGYFLAGALLYLIGLVCMAWDAVRASWIGERLAYLKHRWQERLHRDEPLLPGDAFTDRLNRLKDLEGERPRMRL